MTREIVSDRSVHLMNPNQSALIAIDIQERLIPYIFNREQLLWNVGRLQQAASLLDVAVLVSEQYPRGLGSTVPDLVPDSCTRIEKSMFSCRECAAEFNGLFERGVNQLLLVGIETHVCVQQTCLDLLAMGFAVQIAVDAVGSRQTLDHNTALRRMESVGATLTTTEAAIFEWCVDSKNPQFKSISTLIKQTAPSPELAS
jgi:isochorismate hydrolase